MQEWINSRTELVGRDKPLWMGAHLKKLPGGEPRAYAFLEEQFSTRTADSPENPDMQAVMSAQIYGGTREAATTAATALAEEISSELDGREVAVTGAVLYAADGIQGPTWLPDGDLPRLILNWTVRVRPA
jgi:hypothetical protein